MVDYLVSEFQYLKVVFLSCVCHSNYPYLGWIDIMPLAEDIKILEDGSIKQNNIEVVAQSCQHKSNADKKEKENKTGLIRAEFVELVVRLAKLKFFDTGITNDMV